MLQAIENAHGGVDVNQMIAACELYIKDEPQYMQLVEKQKQALTSAKSKEENKHAILWMNTPEWEALKEAIVKDKALIDRKSRKGSVLSSGDAKRYRGLVK